MAGIMCRRNGGYGISNRSVLVMPKPIPGEAADKSLKPMPAASGVSLLRRHVDASRRRNHQSCGNAQETRADKRRACGINNEMAKAKCINRQHSIIARGSSRRNSWRRSCILRVILGEMPISAQSWQWRDKQAGGRASSMANPRGGGE